jgi:hypothetical protein
LPGHRIARLATHAGRRHATAPGNAVIGRDRRG